MKIAFNTYLSLFVFIVVNTFTSLHVNEVHSATINNIATQNPCAVGDMVENSNDEVAATTSFNPYHNDTGSPWFFDFIDNNNEVEDEEASTRNNSYYKAYLETASINAELFESSSKELQKNWYRPQSDIIEPRLRLHVRFQVFII